MQDSFAIALAEFIHVGGALVGIIAIVSILTGVMREYIPQKKLQSKLAKKSRFGSLIGASFGVLTPFCSASVVPVSMGMAEMGVSMGTIFGFLISAPLCNFVVTGMILAVFGFKVTAIYFIITFCIAVLSGFIMERSPWRHEIKRGAELDKSSGSAPACGAEDTANRQSCADIPPQPSGCCGDVTQQSDEPKQVFKRAMKFAWVLFKRIIPYVLIGALISAVSAAYLPAEIVEKYAGGDKWYSIPIAAAIGIPLYLRIEMAIPLLKVLIAKGMSMGAAMALVIGGTGASLPEIAIISSVLKPKAVVAFIVTVLGAAVLGGIIFQVIL
ncbi:permease [Denitrovibrio acetiphilus DSM 12809]|jgi:uncharacterized membrane protein YraQ (UPF0718 family)|uniref:Permease n=1 Tax=Denitrovibrio acetiphilus (strain DSM 12809 / NBRC 114555 / N2460) TaxID=522772 RepID=D4H663_DENA2|nr:permease [Denitrovibrio acetiphilus]ADD67709.1 permease [Denitrovibrio acetiphilus DSM 12809]